jgi:glycerol kinase
MPPIVDSDGLDAHIERIPVRAAAGDQQASLFGLRCWEPVTAKVTLGTGLAAGVWDDLDAIPEIPLDLVAEPSTTTAERHSERERWAHARDLVSRA